MLDEIKDLIKEPLSNEKIEVSEFLLTVFFITIFVNFYIHRIICLFIAFSIHKFYGKKKRN